MKRWKVVDQRRKLKFPQTTLAFSQTWRLQGYCRDHPYITSIHFCTFLTNPPYVSTERQQNCHFFWHKNIIRSIIDLKCSIPILNFYSLLKISKLYLYETHCKTKFFIHFFKYYFKRDKSIKSILINAILKKQAPKGFRTKGRNCDF